MVVDVQCIMQALGDLTKNFHTELITTSRRPRSPAPSTCQFDEHKALDSAREIVRRAVDNYPNRARPTSLAILAP